MRLSTKLGFILLGAWCFGLLEVNSWAAPARSRGIMGGVAGTVERLFSGLPRNSPPPKPPEPRASTPPRFPTGNAAGLSVNPAQRGSGANLAVFGPGPGGFYSAEEQRAAQEIKALFVSFAAFDRINGLQEKDVKASDLQDLFSSMEKIYRFLHDYFIDGIHDVSGIPHYRKGANEVLKRVLRVQHLRAIDLWKTQRDAGKAAIAPDKRAHLWDYFFNAVLRLCREIVLQKDLAHFTGGFESRSSSLHAQGFLLGLTDPNLLNLYWGNWVSPRSPIYPIERLFVFDVSAQARDSRDFSFLWNLIRDSRIHLARINRSPQKANDFAKSYWEKTYKNAQWLWYRCVLASKGHRPSLRHRYWEKVVTLGTVKNDAVARIVWKVARHGLEKVMADELTEELRMGGRYYLPFIEEFISNPMSLASMTAEMLIVWRNALRRVFDPKLNMARYSAAAHLRIALDVLEQMGEQRPSVSRSAPTARATGSATRTATSAPRESGTVESASAPKSAAECAADLGDEGPEISEFEDDAVSEDFEQAEPEDAAAEESDDLSGDFEPSS